MKKLSEIDQTGKVKVQNVRGERALRILEMGITPGSVLTIIKAAPLGFPLEVKIRGYSLSLRESEAECIEVEAGT
jgi:Fe2+ transport system protein FeoA